MEDRVILVDRNNREIGSEEKLSAHIHGSLHRAFSIFVFNSAGELLIQQRSRRKYHTGGLWSNTCCSHPRPGENLSAAVIRRLSEEMGFSCKCEELTTCYYELTMDNSLIEHEQDHVFIGCYDGNINPNPSEVDNWKWLSMSELSRHMSKTPTCYTPWFLLIMKKCGVLLKNGLNSFCNISSD